MSDHRSGSLRRGFPPNAPAPTAVMWLGRAMIVLGWALILSGLGLFGWECLMWLRDGYWTRSDLAVLWGRFPLGGGEALGWDEMRGLHLILYELLRALGRVPVGVALFFAGLALAWSGTNWHDRAEERLLRRAGGRPRAGRG